MKAITICQPYSHLIAIEEKRVENRTWIPPASVVGSWIAIHAGKSKKWMTQRDWSEYPNLVFGAIECVAWLEAIISIHDIRSGNLHASYSRWLPRHVHASGPQCWILSHVRRLQVPVYARGNQGLWNLDNGSANEVRIQTGVNYGKDAHAQNR